MQNWLTTGGFVQDILLYSSGSDKKAESNEIITAKKVKVPVKLVDAYCQRIVDF